MLLTWRCIDGGFFNGSDDGFDQQLLADGTMLRIWTVMDEFTREGLTLDVALTTSAERVISVLTVLVAQHGAPAYLRSDNGAEFVVVAVQGWRPDALHRPRQALAEWQGGTLQWDGAR